MVVNPNLWEFYEGLINSRLDPPPNNKVMHEVQFRDKYYSTHFFCLVLASERPQEVTSSIPPGSTFCVKFIFSSQRYNIANDYNLGKLECLTGCSHLKLISNKKNVTFRVWLFCYFCWLVWSRHSAWLLLPARRVENRGRFWWKI